MSASYPTKLLLAFRSGNKCAICGCDLTPNDDSGNPVSIGEAAHIEGEHGGSDNKPPAARYNADMTDEQRNHYNNLIYLCRNCHHKIDVIPGGEREYPVSRLLGMKHEHEDKVRQAMLDALAEVEFEELEEATQWVLAVDPEAVTADFSLLPLEDKIKKNDLSQESRAVISMGLGVASTVAHYIESVAQTDFDFPERLKAGFLTEYYKQRRNGVSGDDLFDYMCGFAQQGFKRQAQRSAGLAVLIHLFEMCEVFEK